LGGAAPGDGNIYRYHSPKLHYAKVGE